MNDEKRDARKPMAGVFFQVILAMGLILLGGVFMALMARSFLRAKAQRDWPKVPCVVLVSEVAERQHDEFSGKEYGHELLFGYEWRDEAMTSDKLSLRGSAWSSGREKAATLVQKYPVGMQTFCWVNPGQPSLAVLEPDSLAAGYSIWFPGLFVAGGVGLLVSAVRRRRSARTF